MRTLARKLKEDESGFTLIELLVVILIIGVLAAIAIPVFLNQQKAAYDAAAKSDLRTIAVAQQTYVAQNLGSNGTGDPVELNKLVPKLSTNTQTETWTTSKGYCAVASNRPIGSSDSKFYWYDSALGGVQNGSPAAGGACNIPASERNGSIWRTNNTTTANSEKWVKIAY
jgi:type IV pilus assembly protein PilA